MKKYKSSLVLIGVGFMNFLHGALHIIQFLQSVILFKTSTNEHNNEDSFLDILHNPYFALLWGIIGIITLWIGIRDFIHHKKCDHKQKIDSELRKKKKKRFYLVSFDGEGSGSIWFNYYGFPSHLWIKEKITKKFPQVKKPAIMHIQELSEKDYRAFNCA